MTESTIEPVLEVPIGLNEKEPVRVLHVDDDSAFLKIAKQCLEIEAPLQVETVNSVDEAFAKLEKKEYDVVVSDYQMPGKDGLEFLKELRAKGNAIPFILFTGKGREEVVIKALNLGADRYVSKSGDPETVYCELKYTINEITERRGTEEKLHEIEIRYRTLVENAPDVIYIASGQDGKLMLLNPAFERLTGWKRSEWIGKSFIPLIHPDDAPSAVETFQKTLKGEILPPQELRVISKSGKYVIGEFTAWPWIEKGKIVGKSGIVRDITERKRIEEALAQSEAKYRSLVEQSLQGILIAIGPEPRGIYVNKAMTDIFGYTAEEFYSFSPEQIAKMVHPEDQGQFFRFFKERVEGREAPSRYEFRGIRKDGAVIWVDLSSRRIMYEGQAAVQGIFTDVTERKKAEHELRRFSTAVKTSLDGIVTGDLNGNIADVNEAALRMFRGTDKSDLVGKNVVDLLVERDRTRAIQNSMNSIQTGQGRTEEYSILTKNGTEAPVEVTVALLREEGGEPIGFVDIIRDLTERKKAEEAQRESEERFSRLAAAAFEGIGISEQGKVVDANDQLAKMLGYEPSELIGIAVLNFVAPESRELVMANIRAEFEGPYEHLALRKDGSVFPVEIRARSIHYKGHAARVTAIRDITDRKNVEEGIRKSEERFRSLVEETSVPIAISDLKGHITYSNKALANLLGYSTEELLHRPFKDFLHPKDRGKVLRLFLGAVIMHREPYDFEFRALHKDGHVLHLTSKPTSFVINGKTVGFQAIMVDVTERKKAENLILESQRKFADLFRGNPEAAAYLGPDYRVLDINPRFEKLFGYSLEEAKGKHIDELVVQKGAIEEANALDKKALEGYVYHNTTRRRKDGSLVPVAVSAAPIMIEGKPTGFVAMYKDISDLKHVEKRLDTMNEKLRVVGGLTRHDARNKLSTVTGNLYLAKKHLSDNPQVLKYLAEAESACQQTVKIFDFAGAYERLGAESLVQTDVGKTFQEAVSEFSGMQGIEVTNNCQGLTVLADSLLRQLFYNLVHNSLKYCQKTTAITVYYEKTEQDGLRIVYEDDGVGIPAANKQYLFKEGYSTGGSTDYGLYLIKKMVEVYGWTIQETGEPGKGARFTMTIPKTNPNGKENYHIT